MQPSPTASLTCPHGAPLPPAAGALSHDDHASVATKPVWFWMGVNAFPAAAMIISYWARKKPVPWDFMSGWGEWDFILFFAAAVVFTWRGGKAMRDTGVGPLAAYWVAVWGPYLRAKGRSVSVWWKKYTTGGGRGQGAGYAPEVGVDVV